MDTVLSQQTLNEGISRPGKEYLLCLSLKVLADREVRLNRIKKTKAIDAAQKTQVDEPQTGLIRPQRQNKIK